MLAPGIGFYNHRFQLIYTVFKKNNRKIFIFKNRNLRNSSGVYPIDLKKNGEIREAVFLILKYPLALLCGLNSYIEINRSSLNGRRILCSYNSAGIRFLCFKRYDKKRSKKRYSSFRTITGVLVF